MSTDVPGFQSLFRVFASFCIGQIIQLNHIYANILTHVISEWSYAISRAKVGEYVSNYKQAIPQLHDHMSFG